MLYIDVTSKPNPKEEKNGIGDLSLFVDVGTLLDHAKLLSSLRLLVWVHRDCVSCRFFHYTATHGWLMLCREML